MIGADSFALETDPFGTYVLSSYSYATARDWAKFGQLYLNNGQFNDRKILPDGWVDYTTTPTKNSFGLYGAHWWRGDLEEYVGPDQANLEKIYRALPSDAFFASGYSGQYTVVVPSKKLVIVRLGYTSKGLQFPIGDVVRDIVNAIENK